MSAIKGFGPLTSDELAEVRSVYDDLMKTNRCSHDFVPQYELGDVTEQTFEPLYKKFGHPLLLREQYFIKLERVRSSCKTATAILSGRILSPASTCVLAVKKFGVGECHELATDAWLRLAKLNPILIGASSTPDGYPPTDGTTLRTHVLVVLGVSEEEDAQIAPGVPMREALRILKKGKSWIFDRFLHLLCPASKIETDGSALLRYIDTLRVVHILDVRSFSGKENLQKSLQDVELIYQRARKRLSETECSSEFASFWQGSVAKVLTQDVLPATTRILETCVDGITWKTKVDPKEGTWTVWAQGEPKELQPVGEILKALGAKVDAALIKAKEGAEATSKKYAIIFKDPDPSALRELFNRALQAKTEAFPTIFPSAISKLIACYAL